MRAQRRRRRPMPRTLAPQGLRTLSARLRCTCIRAPRAAHALSAGSRSRPQLFGRGAQWRFAPASDSGRESARPQDAGGPARRAHSGAVCRGGRNIAWPRPTSKNFGAGVGSGASPPPAAQCASERATEASGSPTTTGTGQPALRARSYIVTSQRRQGSAGSAASCGARGMAASPWHGARHWAAQHGRPRARKTRATANGSPGQREPRATKGLQRRRTHARPGERRRPPAPQPNATAGRAGRPAAPARCVRLRLLAGGDCRASRPPKSKSSGSL